MASESKVGNVLKADCSRCGRERNCEVVGHHVQSGGDDNYNWYTDWFILMCRGCDHVFAQTVSTNSEDYSNYYNEIGETETQFDETIQYWPARSKRALPRWMTPIGINAEGYHMDRLSASMSELYGALDSDLNMLAAIGIRTSFDIAAGLLEVDESLSFEKRLTCLAERRLIREGERGHLALLVDAGSASAHRGWKPTTEDLNTLMDMLESFIYESFVLPTERKLASEKIARMKDKIPQRANRVSRRKVEPAAQSDEKNDNPKTGSDKRRR